MLHAALHERTTWPGSLLPQGSASAKPNNRRAAHSLVFARPNEKLLSLASGVSAGCPQLRFSFFARDFLEKNSAQTISIVPPCIHSIDSCHVSSQRDPITRLEDFLACLHAASVASRARCFSVSTMRRWIVLTGHVATIHDMYAGRHGG